MGDNFFRGIATNDNLAFGKDAAYAGLKGCQSNWRKLLLRVGTKQWSIYQRVSDAHGLLVRRIQLSAIGFSLLSSANAKNRLCDNRKSMDKRCCAWQRRQEAVVKAPENPEAMVERILAAGVRARCLLMDSWFAMP